MAVGLRTLVAVMLVGVLLSAIGAILGLTYAFPNVACSGDACLIGPNSAALPSLVGGVVLAVAASLAILARWRRSPFAPKD